MKKEVSDPKIDAPLSVVSRGFFTIKNQLYFSDGAEIYCGFKDWKHLQSLTQISDPNKLNAMSIDEEPEMMKFVFHCTKEILTVISPKVIYRK
ncbi:MAG: hypothetical protein HN576_12500 [Bacteriovoracaceae bacterium]|nr:hypothetical protein [Bacteriovoracaceae bacterium]